MSGTIDFAEFLAVINFQKENAAKDDGAREIVFAFTACGGNSDKSGYVKTDRVVHVVKEIFKLHFDIKSLMDSLDEEEEGQVRGSSINITPSFYSFSLFLFIIPHRRSIYATIINRLTSRNLDQYSRDARANLISFDCLQLHFFIMQLLSDLFTGKWLR